MDSKPTEEGVKIKGVAPQEDVEAHGTLRGSVAPAEDDVEGHAGRFNGVVEEDVEDVEGHAGRFNGMVEDEDVEGHGRFKF